MWFSPKSIVHFARPCNCPPTLVDLDNNLLATNSSHHNAIFSISENEWNACATCMTMSETLFCMETSMIGGSVWDVTYSLKF